RVTFTSRASINRQRVRLEMPRNSAAWGTPQGLPTKRVVEAARCCSMPMIQPPARDVRRGPDLPTSPTRPVRVCRPNSGLELGCGIRFDRADLPGIEGVGARLT